MSRGLKSMIAVYIALFFTLVVVVFFLLNTPKNNAPLAFVQATTFGDVTLANAPLPLRFYTLSPTIECAQDPLVQNYPLFDFIYKAHQ
jgi:uncharacterized membrane protein YkgB